jgi:hypothetical protein
MEPTPFRSLVQQHLLPLFSGAELLRGTSPSLPQRPAVAERGGRPAKWCKSLGSAPA